MAEREEEEKRLRTVALQNASAIQLARQRAERELAAERERLRITLSSIGDGVISTDVQGRVEFLNRVAEVLTGWPQAQAAGRPLPEVFQIFNEHTGESVENPAARALDEGVVVGLANHTVLQARDGTRRPIDDSAAPMFDESGVPIGAVLVFRDVTERKQAEKHLAKVMAESERRRRLYETALSNTPDLVYVFDLQHRFTYANEALLSMWCRTWDEAIGKTCLEVGYAPWHAELHDREIDQVIATRRPIRGDVPLHGANGRRVYDYIFVPVIGANGEVEAVAGTSRDVTDRNQHEEAVKQADRRKDEFLALLAHELRNPLAPIRNGLQVLRLADDDPVSRTKAREMMERQLGHMVRLVDDLLDVSRITRNKMELRRTRVPLADVIGSAVETALPWVEAAGHELSLDFPREPLLLDADLTRLAQVFSNLLTNSAKYTPPGGKIWLAARVLDGEVVVTVRDAGIGIPRDELPRIFDMFSQVDRSIEKNTGGLGIGLALVKGLTEMHGGTVVAHSDGPGAGSTFTVRLPIVQERSPESTASPVEWGRGEPVRRVLVVDDNWDGAESLAEMLALLGHETHTAHDGREAIEAAGRIRPELVLMDVGMPRMNGLDATRQIREKHWGRAMKIFALTGWGQDGDRVLSREAGCDGHLVKPVNLDDLRKLLGELTTT